MPSMNISTDTQDNVVTVKVEGDITARDCEHFRERLLEEAARKPAVLILDLSGVPFIDSSGLGVLVGVKGQLKKYKTELVLKNLTPDVIKVFHLTRLSRIFGIPE
jgi:anti-sigma B factor antagonist